MKEEPQSLIAGAVAPKAKFDVGVDEVKEVEQEEKEEAMLEEFRKEESEAQNDINE